MRMTAREAKRQYQIKEWVENISSRVRSGMPVKTWCSENGFSPRIYYYWLKQVREYAAEMLAAAGGEFAISTQAGKETSMSPAVPDQMKPPIVPSGWAVCTAASEALKNSEQRAALPVEIGKFRIMADTGVDTELLANVCKVLASIC